MGAWIRMLDMWDRDWHGRSFNGRCLFEELAAHTAFDAVLDRNFEEYTVWGVALHVHKYKEMMLANLEGREPALPEGEDEFPPLPNGGITEERWIGLLHAMDATHNALVTRARALDEAFLDTSFAPWEITWGETFAWAAGHDGYHTAQIRNMKR